MKQLAALLGLSLLLTSLTFATQGTAQHDRVSQTADPAGYADDICWVAPEWRDEG